MNFLFFVLTSYFLNNHKITFEKPQKISYSISFTEKKIDKDKNKMKVFFSSFLSLSKERELLEFKDIESFHILNSKKYINKLLDNKEFKSKYVYKNGLFIPENINFINENIIDLIFLKIDFPDVVYNGYTWTVKRNKIIDFDSNKYFYKEILNIKFIKKEKEDIIFNIKYNLKNDSSIQKDIIKLSGNIVLIISNKSIKSIKGNYNMELNKEKSEINTNLVRIKFEL